MRNDIETRKNDILVWISENRSKAEIARILNCRVGTLQNALARMGIEYGGNKGSKGKESTAYKSAHEYMAKPAGAVRRDLRRGAPRTAHRGAAAGCAARPS